MKWLLVVAGVLAAIPACGADIRFDPAPTLGGTFRVVVTGTGATTGQVTLVVLRTGEVVQVAVRCTGTRLESGEILAHRGCGPAGAVSVQVQLGDTLVAATDLGEGLSATARVAPPPGSPALGLERWDNVALEWVQAETVGPAHFRVVLDDPSLDTTCDRDTVVLPVSVGGAEFSLALIEQAPLGGRFSGEFALTVEPRACDLWVEVKTVEGTLLAEAPLPTEGALTCEHEGVLLRVPLRSLPVALAAPQLTVPVGCVGEVGLTQPDGADEVRWCVDGVPSPVMGAALGLLADAPRVLQVVALVREGMLWGRAEARVEYVPQVAVSFVDARTGLPVSRPWPCSLPLRVRVDNAAASRLVVMVGKFGTDPGVRELALDEVEPRVFLSASFTSADFGACAGVVLWAQYVDPRCPDVPHHDTVPLR